MINIIMSALLCFASAAEIKTINPDPADSAKGYVEINGRKLYVEYQAPKADQPLVVNLNGLTYSTEQWQNFNQEIKREIPGAGILTYDMVLQGRSLAVIPNQKAMFEEIAKVSAAFGELTKVRTPMDHWQRWVSGEFALDYYEWMTLSSRLMDLFVTMGTTNPGVDSHYTEDTDDLKELIRLFGGGRPVHIVGLSYGGAIGLDFMTKHSELVESAVIMAPFMKSLPQQDSWIRVQMQIFRATYPWYIIEDEKLYDFFLRVLVYATYPTAEPIILENYLKIEAVYRKAQGSKTFNAYDIANRYPRDGKIHLITALRDEYVSKQSVDELWDAMPKQARGSYTAIDSVGHKIVEEAPAYVATMVKDIVTGEMQYSNGNTLLGDAKSNRQPVPKKFSDFHAMKSVPTHTPGMDRNPLLAAFNPFMSPAFVACHNLFSR